MTITKQCENGDGVGNFAGFGHVFCWACYSRYMRDTYGLTVNVLDAVEKVEKKKQPTLFD